MDRGVTAKNTFEFTIHLNFNFLNGLLACLFIWLIKYLSIIKVVFDIVLRAVNAYRDNLSPPQLEQINTTIEHTRISFFDNVSKARNVTIAIVSQNTNSAVRFLLYKILESEAVYD